MNGKMIFYQLRHGITLREIERSIRHRIRLCVISSSLLCILIGCVIGVILHKAQVDPIIQEAEKDRALLSQCKRDKISENEWKRHIVPRLKP